MGSAGGTGRQDWERTGGEGWGAWASAPGVQGQGAAGDTVGRGPGRRLCPGSPSGFPRSRCWSPSAEETPSLVPGVSSAQDRQRSGGLWPSAVPFVLTAPGSGSPGPGAFPGVGLRARWPRPGHLCAALPRAPSAPKPLEKLRSDFCHPMAAVQPFLSGWGVVSSSGSKNLNCTGAFPKFWLNRRRAGRWQGGKGLPSAPWGRLARPFHPPQRCFSLQC